MIQRLIREIRPWAVIFISVILLTIFVCLDQLITEMNRLSHEYGSMTYVLRNRWVLDQLPFRAKMAYVLILFSVIGIITCWVLIAARKILKYLEKKGKLAGLHDLVKRIGAL